MSSIPRATLTMARSARPLTALLSRIIVLLGATGFALAGVAAFASGRMVRRGLAPLGRFAGTIARIDDRHLASRVSLDDLPAEILPVGDRLNDLLSRLDTAMTKERSFSAAIAHELRTPIAGLRSTIDVTLRHPRDAVAYRAGLEECAQSLDRLQSLVERLLWLVRLDSGNVAIEIGPVDCVSLARSCRDAFEDDIRARGLDVIDDLPTELIVTTDAVLLGIALRNLWENAVAYADDGGTIHLEGDGRSLRLTNTGSRVAQDSVDTLFDRFARGDESRAATGSQCGLGLSIVQRIAATVPFSIEIRTEIGGRFEVRLDFDETPRDGSGAPRATRPRG